MTLQRTLDPASPSTGSGGGGGATSSGPGVSAADVVQRLGGGSSSGVIRRTPDASSSSADTIRRTADQTGTIRRADDGSSASSADTSVGTDTPPMSAQDFEKLLRQNFDLIVDLLEQRIIVDLERRGGRFRGDF